MVNEPENLSVRGFWIGTRVPNLIIIVFTQFITTYSLVRTDLSITQILSDPGLLLVIASTVMVAAAGYLINDYFDVKIDYINKPERVVVGRLLKRRVVLVVYQAFNIAALLIGLYVGWQIVVIHLSTIGLLWFYSHDLKRHPLIGNIVIGLLTSASLIIVAMYYHSFGLTFWIYAAFAFFFTVIRELIKDAEDLKGDAAFGYQTLPVIWGYRKTKIFMIVLLGIFMTMVTAVSILLKQETFTLIAYALVPITLFYAYRIYFADTKKDFSNLSLLSKIIMIVGITSMFIFRLGSIRRGDQRCRSDHSLFCRSAGGLHLTNTIQ